MFKRWGVSKPFTYHLSQRTQSWKMPFLSCIMYRFSTAFFAGAMDMNWLTFGAVSKRRSRWDIRHLFFCVSNFTGQRPLAWVTNQDTSQSQPTNQMEEKLLQPIRCNKFWYQTTRQKNAHHFLLFLTSCVLRWPWWWPRDWPNFQSESDRKSWKRYLQRKQKAARKSTGTFCKAEGWRCTENFIWKSTTASRKWSADDEEVGDSFTENGKRRKTC